jgi:HPt (histidine-containing phosphotransfer) domain-containing protein
MPSRDESEETLILERFASIVGWLGTSADDLIAEFRALALTGVAALEQAIADGDFETARSAAHRLRGSSMMLGVPRLSRLSEQIEQAALAGREIAPELLAALRPEIARAHEAMLAAGSGTRSTG